jgi:hypothetical protein
VAHAEPVPLTWLFNYVRPYAVRITSTSGGAHVPSSFHYIHRAIDVVGPPGEMRKLARNALATPKLFREVFYDPMGRYVKNGEVKRGQIGGHNDHVHLAR